MKVLFKSSLCLLLLAGCARIPLESVTLSDALQTEGARMHSINLNLLNDLFTAKRTALETFISDRYTPSLINNVFANNPAVDKRDFPDLLSSVTRKVIAKRDSLMGALDMAQQKLTAKLKADYGLFVVASAQLSALLSSAVKVAKERQSLAAQVKSLSGNKLDFTGVEDLLDKFIKSAGDAGTGAVSLNSELDNLLKK